MALWKASTPAPLSSSEKHARRLLAVRQVLDGRSRADVADFLGVHPVTLAKWMARDRARGEAGLDAKPVPGRPRRLTPVQEGEVLSWLTHKPTAFGFLTDLWTAARVARLIRERLGVTFHPNYLREWLASRGHSPQKPQRKARPQNPAELERWLGDEYPEAKKSPPGAGPPRPDRRDGAVPHPPRPEELVEDRTDPDPGRRWRPSQEGVGDRGTERLASPAPPGLLLPDARGRLLRGGGGRQVLA